MKIICLFFNITGIRLDFASLQADIRHQIELYYVKNRRIFNPQRQHLFDNFEGMNIADQQPGRWQNVIRLIVPYFLVVGFFQLCGYWLLGLGISDVGTELDGIQELVVMIFNASGTSLLIWLFLKYVERKSLISAGLHWPPAADILAGLLMGLVIMAGGYIILLYAGEIQYLNSGFSSRDFLRSFFFFVLVAFTEELLMRGYVLNNLMGSMNRYKALLLSSAIFSLMHLGNANYNWFAALELFLAGILLGLSYVYTRNLWFPIALHFSWNFFQGTLFGFNVSGRHTYSVINQLRYEDTIWNGGAFGFEGSLLSMFLQVIAIGLIYLLFHRRKPAQYLPLNKSVK
jgi:membrane protease YdiL (CAAX protease family)